MSPPSSRQAQCCIMVPSVSSPVRIRVFSASLALGSEHRSGTKYSALCHLVASLSDHCTTRGHPSIACGSRAAGLSKRAVYSLCTISLSRYKFQYRYFHLNRPHTRSLKCQSISRGVCLSRFDIQSSSGSIMHSSFQSLWSPCNEI